MESFYEPLERFLHCSAKLISNWLVYGGKLFKDDKGYSPSVIDEFDLGLISWKQRETRGDPPPGYIGSAAASIGSKFYVFGGLSAKGYFNTINELDIGDYTWKLLEPSNEDGVCPIPKIGAGMVSFDDRLLVTFGGKGVSTAHVLDHALYVKDPKGADDSIVFTNELLCFDVVTSKLISNRKYTALLAIGNLIS